MKMELFNISCNFLRLIPEPCLSGLFPYLFFLLLFPFLFVLFFKLAKVPVHFIITTWI